MNWMGRTGHAVNGGDVCAKRLFNEHLLDHIEGIQLLLNTTFCHAKVVGIWGEGHTCFLCTQIRRFARRDSRSPLPFPLPSFSYGTRQGYVVHKAVESFSHTSRDVLSSLRGKQQTRIIHHRHWICPQIYCFVVTQHSHSHSHHLSAPDSYRFHCKCSLFHMWPSLVSM